MRADLEVVSIGDLLFGGGVRWRKWCGRLLERRSCPVPPDLELGAERNAEAVVLPCLYGVPDQQLADLLGDRRSAADDELVMDPQREISVAVRSVAEAGAKLSVRIDEPALADDGLGRGDDAVERLIIGAGRHAAAVEPFDPAVAPVLGREPLAQRTQTRGRGDEFVARAPANLP